MVVNVCQDVPCATFCGCDGDAEYQARGQDLRYLNFVHTLPRLVIEFWQTVQTASHGYKGNKVDSSFMIDTLTISTACEV